MRKSPIIRVLLAQTRTPTGVYMGVLHTFLLSWSEDLKLRGEHRGPRLERTLQKCELYVGLTYFHKFLMCMTNSVLNIINLEIKLTAIRTQDDLLTPMITKGRRH